MVQVKFAQRFILLLLLTACCLLAGCSGHTAGAGSAEIQVATRPSFSTLVVFGNGVNAHYARRAFDLARVRFMAATGIDVQAESIIYLHRSTTGPVTPGRFVRNWKNFVEARISDRFDLVFLFLPESSAFSYLGQRVSGFSEGVGIAGVRPNALAFTIVSENYGLDSYIALHEIGHLFGGTHSDGGIMAAKLTDLRAGFQQSTLQAISSGYSRKGWVAFRSDQVPERAFIP